MNWIRTSDQLPEINVPILIVSRGETQEVTYVLEKDLDYYCYYPWYFEYENGAIDPKFVSHWMPIPISPFE